VGSNASTVALRVVGDDEGESLESETVECGWSPAVLGPEIALAKSGSGCGRRTRPLIGGRRPASAGQQLSNSGGNLVVGLRWVLCSGTDWPTDRLTVRRNKRLDSTSSCVRDDEYEHTIWRHLWGRCFISGPPRIYASRDSRLTLQGVETGSIHFHRSPASRKRRQRGNPVPGVITGPTCSWGDTDTRTWHLGWGSLESESVKCGRVSCGTRTFE
jgi:hypothetical protein